MESGYIMIENIILLGFAKKTYAFLKSATYPLDSTSNDILSCSDSCSISWSVLEVSNEGDSYSHAVITEGMGPHLVPASAFINGTILTYQPAIGNVRPTLNGISHNKLS